MRKIFLSLSAFLLLAGNVNAATIGYSNQKISRANMFRLGDTEKQGQAIRIPKAKLQALKGKTIDFAEFVVSSVNTNDKKLHVFLTTSLDATPIAEGTIDITRAFKECKWTLDKPYTITGEEENLYIGYTAEIPTTYKLLFSDGSYDINGYNFAYKDGEWVDTYGMNKGSALISFNVDGEVNYTDVIMGRTSCAGYFKAGNNYSFDARFINEGTTTITSFDAKVKNDGKETTQHFENLSIRPKGVYNLTLNDISTDSEGEKNVEVEIFNVNGGNNDIDTSDNTFSGNIFFYPNNMERSILVEGFTGQDCSNCPGGHLTMNSVIENSTENIVEVSHHAGYYPDMYTMKEDGAYLFYYPNPSSTFAPAVMVNRKADQDISSAPVIAIDNKNLKTLITKAAESKPYVSLNLYTKFDDAKRELKIKLQIKPHEQITADSVLFNVFLTQDNIQGPQSNGGSEYIHHHVFRGTVTGNSWGILLTDLTPGKVSTWEKTITIPESIHSSYWTDDMITYTDKVVNGETVKEAWYEGKYKVEQTNIKTVIDDMSVVAYVSEYDTSNNAKNVVYNCTEAKLGTTHTQAGFGPTTGVETIENNNVANVYVRNGKVMVDGKYDKLYVYSITGGMVDANSTLSKGAYIIKVVAGNKQMTKKILVR